MSGYALNQIPTRLAMGAASAGLGLLSYGLYKVGLNLDLYSAGAPAVLAYVPPAAAGLLTAATAVGAVSPMNDPIQTGQSIEAPAP